MPSNTPANTPAKCHQRMSPHLQIQRTHHSNRLCQDYRLYIYIYIYMYIVQNNWIRGYICFQHSISCINLPATIVGWWLIIKPCQFHKPLSLRDSLLVRTFLSFLFRALKPAAPIEKIFSSLIGVKLSITLSCEWGSPVSVGSRLMD